LCRCPGVFKTAQTGCGAPLHPVQKQIQLEDGRIRVVAYWACDSPSCDFRDVLHDRLEMPRVALEAISAKRGFQVCNRAEHDLQQVFVPCSQ
jgi:hypothetical protein